MQQVSFPDINSTPTQQVAPPCKNTPIPAFRRSPAPWIPKPRLLDAAAPRPLVPVIGRHRKEPNVPSDEGPLTLDRSRTVDEEFSDKVIDFLDRNDPKKTNKPFFVWYNRRECTSRPCCRQNMKPCRRTTGGKDWGIQEAGMKQLDDNIGDVLKKLEEMGQLDNTIVVFTTDNGAEAITFPDGGITPFKGQKGEAWEGGYRAPWWSAGRATSSLARSSDSYSHPSIGFQLLLTSQGAKRATA